MDNKTLRPDGKKVALLLEKLGYPVFEYLLMIKPCEDIYEKIKQIKENFAQKYHFPFAKQTLPHITIAEFGQYESKEKALINKLKELTGQLSEFNIELNGFGNYQFLTTNAIYINVINKMSVMNAVKKIKQAQALMKMNNDNRPKFTTDPHLTIARKLLPSQYEKAWIEYEHKSFAGSFLANEMILLKRPVGGVYTNVAAFPFKDLPPAVQQATLF